AAWITRIHYVQQQGRLPRFGQSGAECSHELVWQLANESHGIGHHGGSSPRQRDTPHRWIECGKKLVRDIGIGTGHRAEQRGLASIGIPHERKRRHRYLSPHLSSGLTLLADPREPLRQQPYSLSDQAAIGLELRFAGAAHADSAFLTLQMRPAAYEPRAEMFELCELDLQLPFEAAGPLREDVENEAVPVEHPPAGELLQVALLAR